MKKIIILFVLLFSFSASALTVTGSKNTNVLGNNLRTSITVASNAVQTYSTNQSKGYARSLNAQTSNRITWVSNATAGGSTGSSKPDIVYSFPSGSQVGTCGLELIQITNGTIIVVGMDNVLTNEFIGGDTIQVPHDVKTNGVATLNFYGFAKTASATSNHIKMRFWHARAGTNGSSVLSTFYSNRISPDFVTSQTQGNLNCFTLTNYIGNTGLKWRPRDQVRVKLTRHQTTIAKLLADWCMTLWTIRIPRE